VTLPARRSAIRRRMAKKTAWPPHPQRSGLAVGRTMAALLETAASRWQVLLPQALVPTGLWNRSLPKPEPSLLRPPQHLPTAFSPPAAVAPSHNEGMRHGLNGCSLSALAILARPGSLCMRPWPLPFAPPGRASEVSGFFDRLRSVLPGASGRGVPVSPCGRSRSRLLVAFPADVRSETSAIAADDPDLLRKPPPAQPRPGDRRRRARQPAAAWTGAEAQELWWAIPAGSAPTRAWSCGR